MTDSLKVLRKHRRIYLASPYTKYEDGIHAAWKAVIEVAAHLFKAGIDTYTPIGHHHPIAIAGNLDPLDHKIWLPANESQISDADACVIALLPGWDESYGIQVEIDLFQKANKPIYYLDPVTLEVTEVRVPIPIRADQLSLFAEEYHGA